MARTLALTIAGLAGSLAVAAPALATGMQVLGETSSSADLCGVTGPGYAATQAVANHAPSYTATADGVVTSWSTYVGAVDSTTAAQLDVFDPSNEEVRSQSPLETTLTPNAMNTFTAGPGLVVHAGDTVAFGKPADKTAFCQFNSHDSADTFVSRTGGPDGPQPGDTTGDGGGGGGIRVNIQAVVEPDADHDGYGDLTQDQCPTDASTHGPCPAPGNGGSTPGSGGSAPHDQGTPGPGAFRGAGLSGHTLKVVGGFALVDETCDRTCSGNDTLSVVVSNGRLKAAAKRKRRTIVLGKGSFHLAGAGTAHVKIKLSKAALAALKKHGRFAAKLTAVARDAAGHAATTGGNVTLKLVKPRRHR